MRIVRRFPRDRDGKISLQDISPLGAVALASFRPRQLCGFVQLRFAAVRRLCQGLVPKEVWVLPRCSGLRVDAKEG